ncbi:hypothetical protein CPB86DRAFT_702703, partial [Serendipita vermifera]
LIAKYMFPRQYGLHNVFTCPRIRGAWPFRDYAVRDEEIKRRGPVKTPQRLKKILPLIRELSYRHRHTDYYAILQRECPSKVCTLSTFNELELRRVHVAQSRRENGLLCYPGTYIYALKIFD